MTCRRRASRAATADKGLWAEMGRGFAFCRQRLVRRRMAAECDSVDVDTIDRHCYLVVNHRGSSGEALPSHLAGTCPSTGFNMPTYLALLKRHPTSLWSILSNSIISLSQRTTSLIFRAQPAGVRSQRENRCSWF